MVTGCIGNTSPPAPPPGPTVASPGAVTAPYFPVQKLDTGSYGYPNALMAGVLELKDGYLQIVWPGISSYPIIWPAGYSLVQENNALKVMDDKGNFFASPEDVIQLGGGPGDFEYYTG